MSANKEEVINQEVVEEQPEKESKVSFFKKPMVRKVGKTVLFATGAAAVAVLSYIFGRKAGIKSVTGETPSADLAALDNLTNVAE